MAKEISICDVVIKLRDEIVTAQTKVDDIFIKITDKLDKLIAKYCRDDDSDDSSKAKRKFKR